MHMACMAQGRGQPAEVGHRCPSGVLLSGRPPQGTGDGLLAPGNKTFNSPDGEHYEPMLRRSCSGRPATGFNRLETR